MIMEPFKSCQKYLMNVGINSRQSSRKHLFNARNVTTLIVTTLSIISNTIFLLQDAKTFEKYTTTIYALSTAMVSTATYVTAIWKMAKLFQIFDNFQNIIDKS